MYYHEIYFGDCLSVDEEWDNYAKYVKEKKSFMFYDS